MEDIHKEAFVSGALAQLTGATIAHFLQTVV